MIPEKGKVLEDSKVPLLEVNVDTDNKIAAKYGVRSIPCFIVIEDGVQIHRRIGMQTLDQLKKLVE